MSLPKRREGAPLRKRQAKIISFQYEVRRLGICSKIDEVLNTWCRVNEDCGAHVRVVSTKEESKAGEAARAIVWQILHPYNKEEREKIIAFVKAVRRYDPFFVLQDCV